MEKRVRSEARRESAARFLLFSNDDEEFSALAGERLVDHDVFAQLLDKLFHDFNTELGMGAFAAPEHELNANLVALSEEFFRLLNAVVKIVGSDLERESNPLNVDFLLLRARFPFGFLELVLVGSVVEKATNWRGGVRSNLDEIVASLKRNPKSIRGWHDAELLVVFVDQSNLGNPDELIDAKPFLNLERG